MDPSEQADLTFTRNPTRGDPRVSASSGPSYIWPSRQNWEDIMNAEFDSLPLQGNTTSLLGLSRRLLPLPRYRQDVLSMDHSEQDNLTSNPTRGDPSASGGPRDIRTSRQNWEEVMNVDDECMDFLGKSFRIPLRKPPPFPKLPRSPTGGRIPKLPRKFPHIVVGGGVLSYLYRKKVMMKIFRCCWKAILVGIMAYTVIKLLRRMRERDRIEGLAPDRVGLIVCEDVLSNDASRNSLLCILENPKFFAIFPTFVMEGIVSEMECIDRYKSFRASAARKMIVNIVNSGRGTIENELLPDLGWESSDEDVEKIQGPQYEHSILNCAITQAMHYDLVYLITSSRQLKAQATTMGLLCNTPTVLLDWSRG